MPTSPSLPGNRRRHRNSLSPDLHTWQSGLQPCGDFARIHQEMGDALEQERRNVNPTRKAVFPLISSRPNAPPGAGVFQATIEQLKATQRNVLFNGGIEA